MYKIINECNEITYICWYKMRKWFPPNIDWRELVTDDEFKLVTAVGLFGVLVAWKVAGASRPDFIKRNPICVLVFPRRHRALAVGILERRRRQEEVMKEEQTEMNNIHSATNIHVRKRENLRDARALLFSHLDFYFYLFSISFLYDRWEFFSWQQSCFCIWIYHFSLSLKLCITLLGIEFSECTKLLGVLFDIFFY